MQAGEHLEENFVKMNPQHTIPFLDDNGFYLSESRAILQYLAESRASEKRLCGRTARERALVQQRLQFDIGTLTTRNMAAFYPIIRGQASTVSAEAMQKVREAIGIVDTYLSKSPFIAGDYVTIADFSYLLFVAAYVVCIYRTLS